MDGATLQAKAYYGYAKSAQYIGTAFAQYRPTAADNPTTGTPINPSLLASFNAKDMKYGKAQDFAKATWYCLADGTQLQVFDYLVGERTFYIAAMQPLLPILAVECNRTVNVMQPQIQGPNVGGITDYEGTDKANETAMMVGWPASILTGTKGEKGEVSLPGDVRNPWWKILIPFFPGVTIRAGWIIEDDLNRRHIISSAELTELGWNIVAQQGQA